MIRVEGHDFRRSFGRIANRVGAGLENLRHMYGHESFDVSACYLGLDEVKLRETIGRFVNATAAAAPTGGSPNL